MSGWILYSFNDGGGWSSFLLPDISKVCADLVNLHGANKVQSLLAPLSVVGNCEYECYVYRQIHLVGCASTVHKLLRVPRFTTQKQNRNS